jgi:hypothetical protein
MSLSNQKLKELNEMSLEDPSRPPVVETNNFRHSKKMQFPNAPVTDRQYKYLKDLGYSGAVPKTRKEASDIISSLLNVQPSATAPAQTEPAVKIVSQKMYNMEGDEIDESGNIIRKGARFN